MLPTLCFFAALSGVLAQHQFAPEQNYRSPTPQPAICYPPHDVEEVAARKRNYQAAFAALASRTAAQSRILTDDTFDLSSVQPLVLQQANLNLHHRSIPIVPTENRRQQVHSNRRVFLATPEEPNTPIVYPFYFPPYNLGTFRSNPLGSGGTARQPLQPVVILHNGFIADTPEVEAARKEHLAAVERAKATSVRAAASRTTLYSPAYRRHPTDLPLVPGPHTYG